jgi:hypothetical protein
MAAAMQMNSGCLQEVCAVSSSHLRPSLNVNQRRSQRILLTVPIEVSGISSNSAVFSERTSTLVVNAHGALIQLRERVVAGQKLRMRNATTKEEISCAVMDINPGNTVIPEVGVEFSTPNPHFWRVSFPPADWTPRSPEARRNSPAPAVSASPAAKK